jgi:peptidoglycan hydrolase CwlO-like protein
MYKRRGSLIVEGKETQAKIDKKKKEVKELEEKLRRLKNPWGYDKKPIVRW